MYTTSYDGTVRCLDLDKGEFEQVWFCFNFQAVFVKLLHNSDSRLILVQGVSFLKIISNENFKGHENQGKVKGVPLRLFSKV